MTSSSARCLPVRRSRSRASDGGREGGAAIGVYRDDVPQDAAAGDRTGLVVDEEEEMRLIVKGYLAPAGARVVDEPSDGAAALDIVERLDPPPVPTVIVLDNRMPGLSGLDVARELLERYPEQRILLFSAHLNPD